MRAACTVLASFSVVLAAIAAAQSPQEPNEKPASPQPVATIHTTSPLVLVDVVVTDKQGIPIHGLTAKDFHLFEGKDEQQISTFEEHRGVAASPAVITTSLQPDTYTNQRLSTQSSPLCVILLDSLNTAMSDQSFARFQLLKLAQSLPAGSRVAVFRLGAKLTMLQGFNEDTAKLIEMLKSNKVDPQTGPFYNDADMSQALSAPDLTAGMGGSRAAGAIPIAPQNANADLLRNDLVVSMTLRALEKLGLYLGSLPGRKNLVWLAGSFPIDILPNLNPSLANTNGMSAHFAGVDTRGYMTAIRDLAFLLQSGNIVVYPVDVRGLIDNGTYTGARTGSGSAANEVQAVTQGLSSFALTNGQIEGAMETMASITGGRAYFNTNDISGSIVEAFNDGSNYYSLSYKPSNEKWDGKFRRIEVRVDRKDLRLYYRQGYYAEIADKPKNPFHTPDPATGAAMLRGTPEVSEIGFQLHLKPDGAVRTIPPPAPALHKRGAWEDEQLTGPAQHYELDLTIRPSDVQFSTTDGGKYQSDIAVSAIAYDAQGKMLNTIAGEFNSPLPPVTYMAIMHDALHLYLKPGMELPVGRVYLRVGVRDLSSGKIGAFEIPVDVGTSSQRKQ
jgi:VWFA-related protein